MNNTLEVPTIHLNGTAKSVLIEALDDARHAIFNAREALTRTGPNKRDYPGITAGENHERFIRAVAEHSYRYSRLKSVEEELEQIQEAILNQGS